MAGWYTKRLRIFFNYVAKFKGKNIALGLKKLLTQLKKGKYFTSSRVLFATQIILFFARIHTFSVNLILVSGLLLFVTDLLSYVCFEVLWISHKCSISLQLIKACTSLFFRILCKLEIRWCCFNNLTR